MRRVTFFLAPIDRDCDVVTMEIAKRAVIQTAMVLLKGNKTAAARLVGIDRRTLQKNLTWDWKK